VTMGAAAARKDDPDQAMAAARAIRADELVRIVCADLVGRLDLPAVGTALSDLTSATLEVALAQATARVAGPLGSLPLEMIVVAMGSYGGAEMGYGSDADALFVHRPVDGADEAEAQALAVRVVQELVRLIGSSGPDPALPVDADLRPEGKNGPLVRSLNAYAAYYDKWALPWEFQALLRARPVAGSPDLAAAFTALIDPLRYPEGGLDAKALREIRRIKARVESERLPRGADPRHHVKLGPGGLTDVEWTVQLAQLQHGHAEPALRNPNTYEALRAAADVGVIAADNAEQLGAAWLLAGAIRNANMLWKGRAADVIPPVLRDADGVGRIIGRDPGTGAGLAETWLAVARRARAATRAEFYESP